MTPLIDNTEFNLDSSIRINRSESLPQRTACLFRALQFPNTLDHEEILFSYGVIILLHSIKERKEKGKRETQNSELSHMPWL